VRLPGKKNREKDGVKAFGGIMIPGTSGKGEPGRSGYREGMQD
jgi:hypothetical protein